MGISFHSMHTIACLNHEIVDMDPKLMVKKDVVRLLGFPNSFSEKMRKQAHVVEVNGGMGRKNKNMECKIID